MQNTNWEKTKPWLWQVVLLGVIGLALWFGIRPFLSTIQEKMDGIQELSVTREHREKQLDRLPDLEQQHRLIAERARELDIILDKEHIVDFIEQLEALAFSNGVEIEIKSRDNAFLESKVSVIEKKDGTKTVPADKGDEVANQAKKGTTKEAGILAELPLKNFLKLTIILTGEYRSIVQYLHQLETMPYALDVIGVNIKAHPEEGDRVVVESALLNPFTEVAVPLAPVAPSKQRLDAVFETVVYMKD